MSQPPIVLVVLQKELHLIPLMINLKSQGLAAFGASSVTDLGRLMADLRPEIVVIDPTSDECFALLNSKNNGWNPLGLVPVAESEESAQRAHEMGIDEVVMAKDTAGVVDNILDLLLQVAPPIPPSGARMLIVGDDPDLVGIVTNVLSVRGYDVINADSGREALGILENDSEIAVVLLDRTLPDGCGIETLKTIKQRHPQVIAILVNGIAGGDIAADTKRSGAFDCVSKPIDCDDLERRIVAGLFEKESHRQSWWRRFGRMK